MKVIVLAGLVSIEKAQLSIDIANQSLARNYSVQIIDNIARQSLQTDVFPVQRIEGDLLPDAKQIVADNAADVVIIALSEQTHPEQLFVTLDQLQEQLPDCEIYSLAMIDTRTCDCFPNVRQALEMYAGATIMLPYQLDEVLHHVNLA